MVLLALVVGSLRAKLNQILSILVVSFQRKGKTMCTRIEAHSLFAMKSEILNNDLNQFVVFFSSFLLVSCLLFNKCMTLCGIIGFFNNFDGILNESY